ncbi:MAG: hypothetical protein ACJASM_001603 [Salibacteraceae bacterium]|jgi:hypothetical protein|tara:strand:+ start:1201 stop:1419 length:219 start_codon:yes stop_codon:yes gene_type:complete
MKFKINKMKLFLAICSVALFAASFTSCKKDYICECTIGGVLDNSLNIPKAKKADAEAACTAYQFDDEVCTLK